MSLKRGLYFTRMQEKLMRTFIYNLCLFSGTRNIASSLCILLGRDASLTQFPRTWKSIEEAEFRKRLSRIQRKRAVFRFTSDLVAQLCLKQRLVSLSKVENWCKKWLTFDAEVDEYGSRILFQVWSETH